MNTLFKITVITLLFANSCSPRPQQKAEAEVAILAVMAKQEAAWTRGDIEGFMAGYWNAPELAFVGKSGITRGWQQTLENYKKGYPTVDKMGKLTFDIIELERLSRDTYHMIGKYTLTLDDSSPSGHFTLVWRYIDGNWLIVKDHSS